VRYFQNIVFRVHKFVNGRTNGQTDERTTDERMVYYSSGRLKICVKSDCFIEVDLTLCR